MLTDVTVIQLQRAVKIKQRIEVLEKELAQLLGDVEKGARLNTVAPRRRQMSTSARRKIAAAQRARWARQKGISPAAVKHRPKRHLSAVARAKIAAGQRRRWTVVKANKA